MRGGRACHSPASHLLISPSPAEGYCCLNVGRCSRPKTVYPVCFLGSAALGAAALAAASAFFVTLAALLSAFSASAFTLSRMASRTPSASRLAYSSMKASCSSGTMSFHSRFSPTYLGPSRRPPFGRTPEQYRFHPVVYLCSLSGADCELRAAFRSAGCASAAPFLARRN